MLDNLCLLTDSYKVTHHKQYPPDTEGVYSYFESRGGEFKETVFFGLQYFLKRYLSNVPTMKQIAYAGEFYRKHFGQDHFNEDGWGYIRGLGYLPVEIKAVPEGTVVPVSNVLMTIENTRPEMYWLTNWLETLLVQVWYPTTVATQSREIKKIILEALERTGDPSLIDFKLHDFGFRGSTSVESSGIGGCAHLVNFKGTDTVSALDVAQQVYYEEMAGFSIPAAEHSTITSWGEARECDAFQNMLKQFPTGLVAVVSDSYDIYRACRQYWGKDLRDQVYGRDGVLIVRPDSGDPPEVVCRVLESLGEGYGQAKNEKGYKVLHSKVRVIQGDGIDRHMTGDVLNAMIQRQWSADNIAFGSGGGLLQKVNRDTLKFAFKCSAVKIDGTWRDVIKTPVTDTGKHSKTGRLALVRTPTGIQTIKTEVEGGLLQTVFRNGSMRNITTLAEVRTRAALPAMATV